MTDDTHKEIFDQLRAISNGISTLNIDMVTGFREIGERLVSVEGKTENLDELPSKEYVDNKVLKCREDRREATGQIDVHSPENKERGPSWGVLLKFLTAVVVLAGSIAGVVHVAL